MQLPQLWQNVEHIQRFNCEIIKCIFGIYCSLEMTFLEGIWFIGKQIYEVFFLKSSEPILSKWSDEKKT